MKRSQLLYGQFKNWSRTYMGDVGRSQGFTYTPKFTLWESLTPVPLLTVWNNYSTE